MSQTPQTLIIMSQSNSPSSMNLKSANQITMTSQMSLSNNMTTAKPHNYNVPTDIPTHSTENHKLSHNPSMTLQNRSNNDHKANTYCISPSYTIPSMRLGFKVIKLKKHV